MKAKQLFFRSLVAGLCLTTINSSFARDGQIPDVSIDFTIAAERVMDQVVHVKSYIKNEDLGIGQRLQLGDFLGDEIMDELFGPQPQQPKSNPDEQLATGSGVIITPDGYIVTNNHVIDKASRVEIVLHDNRTYQATVIGTDLATDLAILKIDAKQLSAIEFANSDSVRVGQWVLAAGNPFNLNSTVTAGIVSAKTRSINLSRSQYAIESYIQTDAAINPGNSGGALINLRGQLIGINAAIASPTGAYAGYGFAIPANIVKKVSRDIIDFGSVQRGFLGVSIRSLDADLAKQQNLSFVEGVFVDALLEKGAAQQAGLQVHDVIVGIDQTQIKNAAQLQEFVGSHKPGDVLLVKLYRNGESQTISVRLTNQQGSTQSASKGSGDVLFRLGIETEAISTEEAANLGIVGGIRVRHIGNGIIKRETDMREGFIITKVDKAPITSPEALAQLLKTKEGGVLVEGLYPPSQSATYYAFGM